MRAKSIKKDKRGHFITRKDSVHQEEKTISDKYSSSYIYVHIESVTKYNSTINRNEKNLPSLWQDFNKPLLVTDKSSIIKIISKNTKDLKDTIDTS